MRCLVWTLDLQTWAGDDEQLALTAKHLREVADGIERMHPALLAQLPSGGAMGAPFDVEIPLPYRGTMEEMRADIERGFAVGWKCVWRVAERGD
jgi:hypothetical protein